MRLKLSFVIAIAVGACGSEEAPGPGSMAPGSGNTSELPTQAERSEACAQIPSCAEPENVVQGPSRLVWRVRVLRNAEGAVSIESQETFRYPEAFERPPSARSGDVALVALDAEGMELDVALLRFPTELRGDSGGLGRPNFSKTLSSADAVGYLLADEEAARIAVLDAEGTVLDERAVPSPAEALDEDLARTGQGLLPFFGTGPCAHVEVLEGPVDRIHFPPALRDDFTLLPVDAVQHAVIRSALGKLPPLLCAGVRRIAMVAGLEDDVKGAVAWKAGDTMLLNGDEDWEEFDGWGFDAESLARDDMQAWLHFFIAHEAAHNLETLLDVEEDNLFETANRQLQARRLAEETTEFVRLGQGLWEEWVRMHETFQNVGLASTWIEAELPDAPTEDEMWSLGPDEMAARGFLSAYGATDPSEDFAEFVSLAIMSDMLADAGIPRANAYGRLRDLGCVAMRNHSPANLPSDLSAVYTKLSFVRDLGAIEQRHLDSCTGPNVGIFQERVGTSIRQDGQTLDHFGTDPEALLGSTDAGWIFRYDVRGEASFSGTRYPAALRLDLILAGANEIDDVSELSWPRGLFLIRPGQPHSFNLRMPDARAGNFDVIDGIALITEANNERIVGSVVVNLVERRQAPAPVPIPESYDPPLVFRFLLEND